MPSLLDLASGRVGSGQFLQQMLASLGPAGAATGAVAGAPAPKAGQGVLLQQQDLNQYTPQQRDPAMDLGLLADLVQRQRQQQRVYGGGRGGGLRGIMGGAYGGGSASGFNPGVVGRDVLADVGGGIWLHRDIADQARAMIAAAQAAGHILRGSGWRSIEQTRKLQYKRALGIPVARPGHSMHERGAAIDFDRSPWNSGTFRWLQQNAGKYGFKNLPSEAWHWSTTGR